MRSCSILMDKGRIIYEGDIAALKAGEKEKIVKLEIAGVTNPERFNRTLNRTTILDQDGFCYELGIPEAEAVEIIESLFASCRVANLHVAPPSLENVIETILEELSDKKRLAS